MMRTMSRRRGHPREIGTAALTPDRIAEQALMRSRPSGGAGQAFDDFRKAHRIRHEELIDDLTLLRASFQPG